MDEQLRTTTSAGGGQTTTQNPQTAAPQSDNNAAPAGSVQPGTATSLLTSQQGLTLSPGALTTVDLGATTTSTQASAKPRPAVPAKQTINPAILGLSVLLCLVAIATFWWISRSAKSTTLSQ